MPRRRSPSAREAAAQAFAGPHGGTVVRLDEIPDDYVLGEMPSPAEPASDQQHLHAMPEKGS